MCVATKESGDSGVAMIRHESALNLTHPNLLPLEDLHNYEPLHGLMLVYVGLYPRSLGPSSELIWNLECGPTNTSSILLKETGMRLCVTFGTQKLERRNGKNLKPLCHLGLYGQLQRSVRPFPSERPMLLGIGLSGPSGPY